jgi:hypothetical protein
MQMWCLSSLQDHILSRDMENIGVVVVRGVVFGDLNDIENNIEVLTINIPDINVDELPQHYKHHTIGVSACIARLLHGVAQENACYSEKHS